MVLRCLLPPSTGGARARARGEILQRALERVLGEAVEVVVAADYRELGDRLARGDAELAWAPAAVLARLEARPTGGIRAAYKVLRGRRSTYRSAIVVHARSQRHTVEDLRGARAGWVDPLSFGGCLLALEHLRQRGVSPEELSEVRYLGSHPAALAAVVAGETDVSAVSVPSPFNDDVASALEQHAGVAGAAELRAIAITDPAPTDAFVLTEALSLQRTTELEARLFGERAASALGLAMETEGFERAQPGEYARLAKLLPERDRETLRPSH